MHDFPFFDANCAVGAPMNSEVHFAKGVPELLAEMDSMGVERALVRYNIIENGATYANDRIASLLEEDADGRLLGVWHILPEQCEELPPVDEYFVPFLNPVTVRQNSFVPVMADMGKLILASPEPIGIDVEDELRMLFDMPVRCAICLPQQVNYAIAKYYPRDAVQKRYVKPDEDGVPKRDQSFIRE